MYQGCIYVTVYLRLLNFIEDVQLPLSEYLNQIKDTLGASVYTHSAWHIWYLWKI